MSSISTALELNDRITAPLRNICAAINMTISGFETMQYASGTAFDTSSFEAARQSVAEAGAQLNQMIQEQTTREPVIVPVEWKTDNLDVFTSSGMDRFQQEAQSANRMLEQLCSTQDAIAKQAYSTTIFPPDAFQNLNSMAVRVDNIRERILMLEANPVNIGTNTANAELEQLRGQLDQMIQDQTTLNQAMQNMDVSTANAAYLRLSQAISGTERYIRDNVDEQGRFNATIAEGTVQSNHLTDSIKGVVAAYLSVHTADKVIGLSDELTQTTARLNTMLSQYNDLNGTMQTTQELSQMIYQSAMDSRGVYLDTAASVARLGNNASDAFSSTEEIVGFAELVNKQFVIAGASAQESSNAFLQLTQALGSGVLRGDEFNSIFDQAPNLIQSIADYMDVPIGQIREMASEGQITADIVKNAMFAASDEINAKFESMPVTWGQLGTAFQNQALMIFQPVLQRLNQMANSNQVQTSITGVMQALSGVATVALNVIDILATGGAFIADNWSIIAPIIGGIAMALAIYNGVLIAHNAYKAVSNGLTLLAATWSVARGTATAAEAAATTGATAAQIGFNAALLACPLTWIVIAIIAVIAAIYLVVAAINKVQGTTKSATGVICGAVFAAGAFILNTGIGVLNAIIQGIWNTFAFPFLSIIEWVLNVTNGGFDSFGGAVANLIGNIISWFLSLGEVVTKIIDAIFGTNWTAGLESLENSVLQWGKNENAITLDRAAPTIDYRVSYEDAYNKGYDWGQGVENKVSDFFGGLSDLGDIGDMGSYGAASEMASNISNIAEDTAGISDSLDVSEEDLKYLRDIAEQEAINRFTTAEIKLDMSGMQNTVTNTNDLDGIVDGMTTKLLEAMELVREGV